MQALRRFVRRLRSHGFAWLCVVVTGALVFAVSAVTPEVAAAIAAPHREGMVRLPRGSELSLSQAPAGLRAAVARTFGRHGVSVSEPFQQAELTAPHGAPGDLFGYSVALYGSTAVVGAPGKDAAYVFVRSSGKWSRQAKLTAKDGASGDDFGFAVAISGSAVVVGAPFKKSSTGAAYVFVRSSGRWSQQAKLTASDGAKKHYFGWSVAISGSTTVVGNFFKQSASPGAAYVFVRSSGKWLQQAKLTASDEAKGNGFGFSVAISGSTVLVGAYGKNSDTGAAYVFVRSSGEWSQQAELTASDGATGDQFGWSVAIYGSTAVVGASVASAFNSSPGAAYVFVRSSGEWFQQAELTASDGATGDEFSYSVAIHRSTVVVGAPGVYSSTGTAYVFVRSSGEWFQQAEVSSTPASAFDYFGSSVAIYGSTAVISAPDTNSIRGTTYVFADV